MKTNYRENDVVVLLKDITGKIEPMDSGEREKAIQAGGHYSQFLPREYAPSETYLSLYRKSLEENARLTAKALVTLAEKLYAQKGADITLVSLARAGTPIGILLKRYFAFTYAIDVPHYTISIIRDRGIDKVAMDYILERHSPSSIQFVDGWIGKGAITKELKKIPYEEISKELAVLADPAGITGLYGTREDFLIPSSILNAPVSGGFSRTVLRDDLIGEKDFHGAVFYPEMLDVSYDFIEHIEAYFGEENPGKEEALSFADTGLSEVLEIGKHFGIADLNLIKPSIGECTRVLMRRVPEKVLIGEDTSHLAHILALCEEKKVPVETYPLRHYRAVGLIRNMGDI